MTSLTTIRQFMSRERRREATRKGDAFEQKVADFMRSRGWVCEVVQINRRMVRRGQTSGWMTVRADYFGCVDIIAFHPEGTGAAFIQVTTDRKKVGEKARKLLEVFSGRSVARLVAVVCPAVETDFAAFLVRREMMPEADFQMMLEAFERP